ncbi:hypothetical protein BKA61DRAFT_575348 [Leptodontidium sp. MPI-SDFR-AT-0119]|nr:hypothetical protein BKA61DRAFT_575348 [Leptodontidium sp. MPI-SDFR-AT-0119]
MSQKSSIKLNLEQNQPTFQLEPLDEAPLIFKEKLFSKTLDTPKENPEDPKNYRSVTIKCLFIGCRKTWYNQRVYQSTSNYITHYRYSHKSYNISRLLSGLSNNNDTSDAESSQGSSTILDAFSQQRANKRKEPEKDLFNINKFKNLLLNFIISNNISFRAISSISFKELAFNLNDQVPPIYPAIIKEELNTLYLLKQNIIKEELREVITSNSGFSLTLDAWTAINQDAYLGITM